MEPKKPKPGRPKNPVRKVKFSRWVTPDQKKAIDHFLDGVDSLTASVAYDGRYDRPLEDSQCIKECLPALSTKSAQPLRREDPEPFTREKQTRKAKGAK